MQRCKILGNMPAHSDGAEMVPSDQYSSGSSRWPLRQDTSSSISNIGVGPGVIASIRHSRAYELMLTATNWSLREAFCHSTRSRTTKEGNG